MPKRPANFPKSSSKRILINISSSSEDEVMLEEPILENSNSSMARRPTGTVSPPSNNAAVAGPSHLFTSGIHPSAMVALDPRMRITSPEIQILGEVRPSHPQPELLQPVAGPSGIPRIGLPVQPRRPSTSSSSSGTPERAWNDPSTSDESTDPDTLWPEGEGGENIPYDQWANYVSGLYNSEDEGSNPKRPPRKQQKKSRAAPRRKK